CSDEHRKDRSTLGKTTVRPETAEFGSRDARDDVLPSPALMTLPSSSGARSAEQLVARSWGDAHAAKISRVVPWPARRRARGSRPPADPRRPLSCANSRWRAGTPSCPCSVWCRDIDPAVGKDLVPQPLIERAQDILGHIRPLGWPIAETDDVEGDLA